MKFGSLFTGGGGFDIGAQAAGLELAWGVEYIPEIADWCNKQLGEHVRCLDILTADPADFEPVDWLHASPPCPSFSVANSNAGETERDVAMGEAVARFVRHLRPKYFSLENVYGYRHSQSWAAIVGALHDCGYGFSVEHINSADFGVPQKRRRMIVRAVRDTFFSPPPMRPTHSEGGTGGLLPWVGWWEAVADIAHTFPASELANWQKERLANASGKELPIYSDMQNAGRNYTVCESETPASTVTATLFYRPITQPRAILVDNQTGEGLVGRVLKMRKGSDPSGSLRTNQSGGRDYKAVLVEGVTGGNRPPTVSPEEDPAPAMMTGAGDRLHRLMQGSRVVALTPRALARFQTFPDWYELPEKKTLAVTIIGNAVPCLLAQRIVESICASK